MMEQMLQVQKMETRYDTKNEVLHFDVYKGGFVVFDDMLDTYQ